MSKSRKTKVAYQAFLNVIKGRKFHYQWVSDETIVGEINATYTMLDQIGGIGRADLNKALGPKGINRATVLCTPKYHAELAGEGIEYCWGVQK